ncbi:MAG TPA: enoyl-CoA hydratase/isomerase family protein, partial [Roseococcus sp.]|nr:enoyl-CoA hydratase/isomerase family protein [Roseococcus sp.]
MTDELLIERREGILLVTLNRPQARNALTFPMYEGLAKLCAEANDDDAVRAIIVTGAGEKAFAAGTDISQFTEFRTAEQALAYESKIDRILTAVEDCRK